MILICTGSRDLDDAGRLHVDQVLDDLYRASGQRLAIRVGDCPDGADRYVRTWARYRKDAGWNVDWKTYTAFWDLFKPRGAAGPARNKRMVGDGADECHGWFAPPPALNEGTTGCCKLARDAGIKVVEYGREPQPIQMEFPI